MPRLENLSLSQSVTVWPAGGCSNLLPLAYTELQQFPNHPARLWEVVLAGGFPRPFAVGMDAGEWLEGYIRTYVERDVRRLANLGDLSAFQTFMRLAAGRTGQEVNLSRLGNDAGVTQHGSTLVVLAGSRVFDLATATLVYQLHFTLG